MGFESYKPEKKNEVSEQSTKIMEKMRELQKMPFSLKAAVAAIALLGTFEHDSEDTKTIEPSQKIQVAMEGFNNAVETLTRKDDHKSWQGFLSFKQQGDIKTSIGGVGGEFPDFPKQGAGVFEMNSASVLAQDNDQIFEGLVQSYAVDSERSITQIEDAEEIKITVDLEPYLDTNQQIIDAISDRLATLSGFNAKTDAQMALEIQDQSISQTLMQNDKWSLDVPLAGWEITPITDGEGHETGYSITLQLGKIVSANPEVGE